MHATYAHAIDRLISSGLDQGKLGDNLVLHLKERGRMKLLPGILAELRTYQAKRSTVASKVEVAHEKDSARALAFAREIGVDVAHASVNRSLISGWRAQSKGTLVDRSGKRALLELYRKIAHA